MPEVAVWAIYFAPVTAFLVNAAFMRKNPRGASTVTIAGIGTAWVLALWAWHAAEEAEHRGTCHDLYARLGGGYRTRVLIMFSAWFGILLLSLVNTVSLLRRDGRLWTLDTLRGLGYLFGRRGLVTGLAPAFLRYFRRDFEPWDGADPADIERWQAANARYIVNLDQVEQVRSRPAGG